MKSRTPRTDKVASDGWSGDAVAVPYEFAQKLELENKRLKRKIRQLEKLFKEYQVKGTGL